VYSAHKMYCDSITPQVGSPYSMDLSSLLWWFGCRARARSITDHLKNGVFWGVTPCGSCKNWRFGGT
jgi:hypothetical protein